LPSFFRVSFNFAALATASTLTAGQPVSSRMSARVQPSLRTSMATTAAVLDEGAAFFFAAFLFGLVSAAVAFLAAAAFLTCFLLSTRRRRAIVVLAGSGVAACFAPWVVYHSHFADSERAAWIGKFSVADSIGWFEYLSFGGTVSLVLFMGTAAAREKGPDDEGSSAEHETNAKVWARVASSVAHGLCDVGSCVPAPCAPERRMHLGSHETHE